MKSFPPAAFLALVLVCGHAAPAEPPVQLPPVQVTAQRDPVEKSYRRIIRGMDLFEQRRAIMAPNASLRFKLLPRNRETSLQGIALAIVGDTVDIPVSIAPDYTFTLERSRQALAEDAVVTPNRKQHSMSWRTEVRTPGLPPNTRRLGDLRLECMVGMEAELVSGSGSILESIARAISDAGYCNQRVPEYFFFAERPLWSVTLVHGGRREVLAIDSMYAGMSRDYMTASDLRYCDCATLLDRTYYAPLGDRSWPDDTLLQFEYMDDTTPSPSGGR